jgi:FkbM family methyltransferase
MSANLPTAAKNVEAAPSRWPRLLNCLRERRLPVRLKQIFPELLGKLTGHSVVFRSHGRRKFLRFQVDARNMSDLILDEVFTAQVYFPAVDKRTEFRIKRDDVVIDIGANVGLFAACAANETRAKVYCFEPSRANFARLEQHRRLNRLDNMVLINQGVSDRSESVKLYLQGDNCGAHSVVPDPRLESNSIEQPYEEITCVALKDAFDQYAIERCDFLKIDCEGAEAKILNALPAEYFERIGRIALEYHPNVNVLELAELLDRHGFSVVIKGYPVKWGLLFATRR